MSQKDAPRRPPDDDVVFIDGDGGAEDVESALAEAERAVAAVEQRYRGAPQVPPAEAAVEPAEPEPRVPELAVVVEELERRLAVETERAIRSEEELGRLREVLLRKNADFDNLKRRTEREKTDYFRYALSEIFRDLLAVLDNFERAMAHSVSGGTSDDFMAGIEMIARQLTETLRRYGLAEVSAQGRPFDPNVHEAVARVETDSAPAGSVLEVLQKGYVLNDRLLRPAMVKVAVLPPATPGGVAGGSVE